MKQQSNRFHIGAHEFDAPALAPGLYLVATPIGNLGDITLRALQTLAAADVIYCEDTRVTAKLLDRYGMRKSLQACHEHNEQRVSPLIVDAVREGKAVALTSDAGTPLISDPGYRLVQACVAAEIAVTSLPGASAVLTAVQLSGLATDSFSFIGFLPQRKGERRALLAGIGQDRATAVAYESPHRILDTLHDIHCLMPERKIAVARELTKLHEEILRGTADEIRAILKARVAMKGEFVIVIAGASGAAAVLSEDEITTIVGEAAKSLPASKAAAQVARLTGLSRNEAFARILKLKGAA